MLRASDADGAARQIGCIGLWRGGAWEIRREGGVNQLRLGLRRQGKLQQQ